VKKNKKKKHELAMKRTGPRLTQGKDAGAYHHDVSKVVSGENLAYANNKKKRNPDLQEGGEVKKCQKKRTRRSRRRI